MNIDVLKDLSPAEPASAGDLPPFGLFAAGVYPFLEFRWFHEAYYRVLEAFAAGRVRRLIVTMPPQHGKSVGASTLLPAYLLGRNPDLRIAIASYSASLASKFNRRVQRIIDSPEYAAFFPETTIKRGARPPEYLRTADEVEIIGHRGGLLSVGREGALTGNRVDCFILDDLYKEGATFNKVMMLYRFDKKLRLLLFNEIEKIEIAVREAVMNMTAERTGDIYWLTNSAHFRDQSIFVNSMAMLSKEYERSTEDFIEHFKRTYTEPFPPAWILGELLPMGSVNMYYRNLKDKGLKKQIAKRFCLHAPVFESWLSVITLTRNACCHHARVWNKVNKIIPNDMRGMTRPWITIPADKRRIYYNMCIIKYFLDIISPNNDMLDKMHNLFSKFPEIDLAALGFPSGWENEPLWQ